MKKEIDVWIGTNLRELETACQMTAFPDEDSCLRVFGQAIKAKVIVEIPEQKIEISESELKEAMEKADPEARIPGWYEDNLKKELGFK